MVAEYREGRWRISLPGTDGKRRSIPDLRVPSDIVTEEALLTFLHDVYHEAATAKHNTVSVIERKRTGHS
jgi:hypothetical protein